MGYGIERVYIRNEVRIAPYKPSTKLVDEKIEVVKVDSRWKGKKLKHAYRRLVEAGVITSVTVKMEVLDPTGFGSRDDPGRISTVVIDFSRLEQYLIDRVYGIMAHRYDSIECILVGAPQFRELFNTLVETPINFRFPSSIATRYPGDIPRFDGIEVRVVPWLDGVVPVPKISR